MLWVHWQSIKEGIGNNPQPVTKPRSVQKVAEFKSQEIKLQAISMIGEAQSLENGINGTAKKANSKPKFNNNKKEVFFVFGRESHIQIYKNCLRFF